MDFWDLVIVFSLSIITFCWIFTYQIYYIKYSHNHSDGLTDYGYGGVLFSLIPYVGIRIISWCIYFKSIYDSNYDFYGRVFGEVVVWLDAVIIALFWFVGRGKLGDFFGLKQEYCSVLLIILYFIGYMPMFFITFLFKKITRICYVKCGKISHGVIDNHNLVISSDGP
jgi:hypothetical protein